MKIRNLLLVGILFFLFIIQGFSQTQIGTKQIKDGAITQAKIATDSVSGDTQIIDESIPEEKLQANDAPDTGQILFYTGSFMDWLYISELDEYSTPDSTIDYMLIYDATTGLHKKILLENLFDTIVIAESDPIFAEMNTEAELETHIGDTLITDTELETYCETTQDYLKTSENDDNAASLVNIQAACSNDFHNIGGTDANTIYDAGTGIDLTDTTFSLSHLGIEDLVDPDTDKLMGWDETTGAVKFISIGDNLAYDTATQTLSAEVGGGTEYQAGDGLDLTDTTFSLSHLGIEDLSDPNADKIMGWDDTIGAVKFIIIGDNLAYDTATQTLSAEVGGGEVAWGDISGVLSDQTDLQAELDNRAKYDFTTNNFIGEGNFLTTGNVSGNKIGIAGEAYTLGDEMIDNGDFTGNADGWILEYSGEVGWFYDSNRLKNGTGGDFDAYQPIENMVSPMVEGKTYKLVFTETGEYGCQIYVSCGGHFLGGVSTAGTYEYIFTCTDDTAYLKFHFAWGPYNCTTAQTIYRYIDDVSLKEVLEGSTLDTYIGKDESGNMYFVDEVSDTVLLSTLAGKASYSFKTIAVSGQSNVVADDGADTVTLIAGTNITITTNATNDSVTITGTQYQAGDGLDLTDTTFSVLNDVISTDTDITITSANRTVICNTGTTYTISLPQASTVPGHIYTFIRPASGGEYVYVDAYSTELIETTETLEITGYDRITIQEADGTWYIIADVNTYPL